MRIALLLLAAGAVVAAVVLGRPAAPPRASAAGRYVCPMHPDVRSAFPGECPICHMSLVDAGKFAPPAPASISLRESSGATEVVRPRVFARTVEAPGRVEAGGMVRALLYNDDLAGLATGERGVFRPGTAGAAEVGLRRAEEPPAPWDETTSEVRFDLDPGEASPPPGEVGWLTLAAKPRPTLVVPWSAVLQSPAGPYVLVASPDGRSYAPRGVRLGKVLFGLAMVVGGVGEGERVAVKAAFFLDAERRLGERPDPGAR